MIFDNLNSLLGGKPFKYRSLVLWSVMAAAVGSGWLFFRADVAALIFITRKVQKRYERLADAGE